MIIINGSVGEGGGQILRSSLSLSMITGKPFEIKNIRAGRKKPGLLRQHLTAVNAAREISSAGVTGNTMQSTELAFSPGEVRGGNYRFAVGTAGSATLVLQTILPALLNADVPSEIIFEGGTHNPYAPPFHFLERSFLPILTKLGVKASAEIEQYGFYPAGGGKYKLIVQPSKTLTPFDLTERGELKTESITALLARLPIRIANHEVIILKKALNIPENRCRAEEVPSQGPGNVVMYEGQFENVTALFTGFGAKKVPLERVADEVVKQVTKYKASGAPVGPYLADQLLIPFAMAGGGTYRTTELTLHTRTNIDVVHKFMNVGIKTNKLADNDYEVSIKSE